MELALFIVLCLLSRATAKPGSRNANPWWNPYNASLNIKGFDIVEGDIMVPKSFNTMRNAVKFDKYLWKNGIIPYTYDNNFTEEEKNKVRSAMVGIEQHTCVRFVKRRKQSTYINFSKAEKVCASTIGLISGRKGPLTVNLYSPNCFVKGIIQHELLHVVGLYHEHSRYDRDNYVTIHWDNILSNRRRAFRIVGKNESTTFGVPYGFDSIMHYQSSAFSANGKPTITAKSNPKLRLGQTEKPTKGDFQKVNLMYKCKK